MSALEITRIGLPTGVTLTVALGGVRGGTPVILLHGFPESHRTWRALAPRLAEDHFVVAPDQSGFHGGKRRSYGKSAIIDPWGIVLAMAADGPGFAVARLDFAAQDRIRASLPSLQHRHPKV